MTLTLLENGHGEDAMLEPQEGEAGVLYLHYQPWLTASGSCLVALADEVFNAIPAPAIAPGRTHRKDATERRRLCTFNVLAHLVVLAQSSMQYDSLVLPLQNAKRTRYDRAAFTVEVLTACIHALEFLGILSVVPGVYKRSRTRVIVSEGFKAKLHGRNVSLSDIGKVSGGETILLRSREGRQGRTGELVDYADDNRSDLLRREMEDLNAALNAADIRLDGQPVPPIHMVRIFQQDSPGAPPAWSRHGRIYRGSPWLDLRKDQRYRLSMGGERLADLDYSACFLHLAYIRQGAAFPEGDPYTLDGLEGHRAAVKQLTTSLFFRKTHPTRLPKGFKNGLPDGWNMARFVSAISDRHPAIACLFGTEVGFDFFATESALMMAVLKELRAFGVVALPCHDGALVQKTHKQLTIDCMRRVSFQQLGRELPVAEKPIAMPSDDNSPLMA